MSNFEQSFLEFVWERLDSYLIKNKGCYKKLKKITAEKEDEQLYIDIMDYGYSMAEAGYKAGLLDGLRLISEVCANE